MLNTSAITAVTESSMKPQSGTVVNRYLHAVVKKGMENKGEQRLAFVEP